MHKLKEGVGFVIYAVGGVTVMFVHIPNEFATDAVRTAEFYAALNDALVRGGSGAIDLVIGDTNQNRPDFTREALGGGFANAHAGKTISPFDNHEVTDCGTITLQAGPVYLSQSSSGTTVTDDCGLAVTAG